MLSNAFSAEFGWTAGPALNIVTKSGTNDMHGEGLYMARPGGVAGEDVRDRRLLPAVGRDLRDAGDAQRDQSGRRPDELNQFSGSIGAPFVKDKTFFFATADYTRQDRTTFLSSRCRRSCCRRTAPRLRRQLPPGLFNARLDHKLTPTPDADGAR